MFCKIKPVVNALDAKARQTVVFAAKELSRYLAMADAAGDYPVMPVAAYDDHDENAIWLVVGHAELPEVENPELDDGIYISTNGYCGVISGTNARAVLIAAYRFLRENGFVFVKPGKDGEQIPEALPINRLHIAEKASYRHRGICIEGSVYQEGLLDLIDWMPKVSMNAYFLQFLQPSVFLRRYYTTTKGHMLSGEEIEGMGSLIRDEIVKRSLLFHDVGHGWTCEAIGLDQHEIHSMPTQLTEEQRSMLALVNGKREIKGMPLTTNLCYSDPRVCERMTDSILNYCIQHEEVDYLHFWIADGGNNNCECEECVKERASDVYVRMLNLLDKKMTEKNVKTKIVFLIYSGLVWAPLKERIKNQDRFVIMMAPFLRDFTKPLDPSLPDKLPAYALNKQPMLIEDIAEHLSYYREWRKGFDGDGFDFDYHYCIEFLYELTGYSLAKVLHQDIVNFEELGLNGLVSCQNQRNYMPTALGMNVMAATLWNRSIAFDDIVDATLTAQFGGDHKLVEDHLKLLSSFGCVQERHDLDNWVAKENIYSAETRAKMEKSISIIQEFRSIVMQKIAECQDPRMRKNWQALLFCEELHEGMYRCYLTESDEETKVVFQKLMEYAESKMDQFKIEFDFLCFKDSFIFPPK